VHHISSTFLVHFDAKIDEIRPKIDKMCTINQIKSDRILLKNTTTSIQNFARMQKTRESFPSF
ncbi:MAG: hypothetical protein ACI4UG_02405, partial [Candidatus Onthovivens sp.]